MHSTSFAIVLAFLTMVGPLGIDTYLPSFPAIAADLAADPLAVQQTLSVYMAGMACMMLFYGTLSDSFGRRRVVFVSLALFCAASLAAALAPSIGTLIVLRGLQGLTAGAGIVISRAMVQDRYPPHEAQRIMSMITMVFGLAPAIAPVLGGWLQIHLGWRAVFVFLALFAGALLVAGQKLLPETLAPEKRVPFRMAVIAGNYLRALRSRRFVTAALGIAFVFAGMPLYVGAAAEFIMGVLHQPATAFGWLFTPLIGGMVCGAAASTRLSRRMPIERLIRIGHTVMLVAVGASVLLNLAMAPQLPWVVVPLFVYTLGLSLASPGMVVQTLNLFPDIRGLAASMQSFMQMMLFSMVAGMLSPLLYHSARSLAFGHLVLVGIGIALWAWGQRMPAPALAMPAAQQGTAR